MFIQQTPAVAQNTDVFVISMRRCLRQMQIPKGENQENEQERPLLVFVPLTHYHSSVVTAG